MKNIKFSRLFAAMMFVAVLSFAGCKQQPEEKHYAIEGTWLDAGWGESYYVISNSEVKTYGKTPAGVEYTGLEGKDVCIEEIDETSGMIYLKYTKSIEESYAVPSDTTGWTDMTDPNYPDYPYWFRYVETGKDVGKWYAIRYTELEDKKVKISGASNYENHGVTSCDTLEEAKKEFTAEKGYFKGSSDCVRQ